VEISGENQTSAKCVLALIYGLAKLNEIPQSFNLTNVGKSEEKQKD